MTFINPLDVLGIDASTAPDPAAIKKARRRVLVELDLADGKLEVGDMTYLRSDLVRAMNELDDPENVRGYHALQRLPLLDAFLRSGDPAYFRNQADQSHPPDEALVRMISPYFANRYGQTLASALREGNDDLIRALTGRLPLVTPDDSALADRPVDAVLNEMKNDLDTLRGELKAERLDPEDALVQVRFLVSPDALNVLPPKYSTARSQIARQIRHLAVAAFNVYDAVKPAYVLISDAARIETSVDVREDIAKQLAVVREARDQLVLQEQYANELARCADMMVALSALIERVDEGDPFVPVGPADACKRARAIVPTSFLNELPEALSATVVQVAFTLRSLAVSIWNEFEDAAAARSVVNHALAIRLPSEAIQRLNQDIATLNRLINEQKGRIESDKTELRKLQEILQAMTRSVAQYRGDQVRWSVVSEKLCELFSSDLVAWLRAMRQHAPEQVRRVVSETGPLLAGLSNFHLRGYEAVVQCLGPLTTGNPDLETLVSRPAIAVRVAQDPVLRRATSGPEIWEQGWFWWLVIMGMLFMLGMCSG